MQQQQQPSGGPPGDGGGSAGGGLPFGPGGGGGGGGGYLQQFQAQQALAEELQKFWEAMKAEVEEHSELLTDFKTQALPLARIKKIMKSDEDVRMISAEAPILFARACECFIQELSIRAWHAAQEYKRRTVQRSDLATAIARTDIFDFLVDIVPREEANDPPALDGAASGQMAGLPPPGAGGAGLPPLPPQPGMFSPAGRQPQQGLPQYLAAPQQFMQQAPGAAPGAFNPYMPPPPYAGFGMVGMGQQFQQQPQQQ